MMHCNVCSKKVTDRHHAIQCNVCLQWQHCLCSTGISLKDYKRMVREKMDIQWSCHDCQVSGETKSVKEEVSNTRGRDFAMGVPVVNPAHCDSLPIDLNVTSNEFNRIEPILQKSLEDPELDDFIPTDRQLTFKEVEGGTKRGGRIDSDGYCFTVKEEVMEEEAVKEEDPLSIEAPGSSLSSTSLHLNHNTLPDQEIVIKFEEVVKEEFEDSSYSDKLPSEPTSHSQSPTFTTSPYAHQNSQHPNKLGCSARQPREPLLLHPNKKTHSKEIVLKNINKASIMARPSCTLKNDEEEVMNTTESQISMDGGELKSNEELEEMELEYSIMSPSQPPPPITSYSPLPHSSASSPPSIHLQPLSQPPIMSPRPSTSHVEASHMRGKSYFPMSHHPSISPSSPLPATSYVTLQPVSLSTPPSRSLRGTSYSPLSPVDCIPPEQCHLLSSPSSAVEERLPQRLPSAADYTPSCPSYTSTPTHLPLHPTTPRNPLSPLFRAQLSPPPQPRRGSCGPQRGRSGSPRVSSVGRGRLLLRGVYRGGPQCGGPLSTRDARPAPLPDQHPHDAGWSSTPFIPQAGPFTGTPGMQVPQPVTPLQFFQLFFTRELLSFLTEETNSYAEYIGTPARLWSSCSEEDIAKFLGLFFLMGLIQAPTMHDCWCTNFIHDYPVFRRVMSGRRFFSILKHFHAFNNKAIHKRNADELIKVRPVMEYLLKRFKAAYLPDQNLSIDEGILGRKERLSFKVYNPWKPTRDSIKLYILVESKTGYIWDLNVYTTQNTSLMETVWDLMEPLKDKGYRLYMNSFYNSVDMCELMFTYQIYVCGSLHLLKGVPKRLADIASAMMLEDNVIEAMHKDNTMVLLWKEKRIVSMVSTFHNQDTIPKQVSSKVKDDKGEWRNVMKNIMQPVAVEDYNQHMGGIDHYDQMIQYYPLQRRSVKLTKKINFYLIHMALFNAHALYNKYSEEVMSVEAFQEHIINQLVNFDTAQWPDSGSQLHHAPNLPSNLRLSNRRQQQTGGAPQSSSSSSSLGEPDSPLTAGIPPGTPPPAAATGVPSRAMPPSPPVPATGAPDHTASAPAHPRPAK